MRRKRRNRELAQGELVVFDITLNMSRDGVAITTTCRAGSANISEDDALQTKTNEVTDALRRTTTIMQAELERSVLSVQMLGKFSDTTLGIH